MARYTMTLKSVGNPDFAQYVPVSEPSVVEAETLAELRNACDAYIRKWDLGGGNWTNPAVREDRKVVGYFSYNGRLWSRNHGGAEILIQR
jgi:hypothetical protein